MIKYAFSVVCKLSSVALLLVLVCGCGKDYCIAGYGDLCSKLGQSGSAAGGQAGGTLRLLDPAQELRRGETVTYRAVGGTPPYTYWIATGSENIELVESCDKTTQGCQLKAIAPGTDSRQAQLNYIDSVTSIGSAKVWTIQIPAGAGN